jgi:radical SAM protein with 4Fe4S-binding SPASM domain
MSGTLNSALFTLNVAAAHGAYERGLAFAEHLPTDVWLQITSGCDLDCFLCSEHERPLEERFARNLRSMPLELAARVASEVAPFARRIMIGTSGEPLLHPDLAPMLNNFARAGRELSLMTNGRHFLRAGVAPLVARLVSDLTVSLDAATRETFERMRAPAKWTEQIESLERLTRERAQLEKHERGRLTFAFVLARSNVRELPLFVEFAQRMGAERVFVHPVVAVNRAGEEERLPEDSALYADVLAQSRERASVLGVELDAPPAIPRPAATREVPDAPIHTGSIASNAPAAAKPASRSAVQSRIRCSQPTCEVYILHDGRVFACSHPLSYEKMLVGNLSLQHFGEIWNGEAYRALRRGLTTGDALPICRTCPLARHAEPVEFDIEIARRETDLSAWAHGRDLGSDSSGGVLMERVARSSIVEHVSRLEESVRILTQERPHLLGHIANLEREREELRRALADRGSV